MQMDVHCREVPHPCRSHVSLAESVASPLDELAPGLWRVHGARPRAGGEPGTTAVAQVGAVLIAGPAAHRSARRTARQSIDFRSLRNQRSRSTYGTAAFAGEVEGRTNSRVSPRLRDCSPSSGLSPNVPR